MAYANIPDTEIEPGKPGSSSLFTKMRDNPEAIAAGESGAPKIANAAFSDNTISGVKLVTESVQSLQIANQAIHNNKLADGAADFSVKMLSHQGAAQLWHVDNGANYIIPKGIWQVKNTETQPLDIMMFDNAAWVESDLPLVNIQTIISDGVSFALYGTYSGGFDCYARKLF